MELKHEMKMYPPRVKMTILMKPSDQLKLSIDVTGCSSNLDMDLVLYKGEACKIDRHMKWIGFCGLNM